MPGIIAAFMSLGGIALGKVLILVWFMIHAIDRRPTSRMTSQFKRQVVAAIMVPRRAPNSAASILPRSDRATSIREIWMRR